MSLEKKALLADLGRLIDHPDTPEAERENALKKVREIELYLSKAMVKNKKKPGIVSLGNRSSGVARPLRDKWPFGWEGPCGRIDYHFVALGGGGTLVWGCPDCGNRVAEVIQGKLLTRLLGKPEGFRGRIEGRVNGTMNQLCNACWDKYGN